ncbi:MAG: hypothetical protein GC168_20655 [Candidatus Hydrogenedens sp.]|nr:hypothetical protein [Candidatus Hydrogenedens sp.]
MPDDAPTPDVIRTEGGNDQLAGVTLAVDGRLWRGWTSIQLNHGIDQLAATWSLGITRQWPGEPKIRDLRPGMGAAVVVGDEVVLSGYIDGIDDVVGPENHVLTVRGRDATADLVDASVLPPFEFSNLDLAELARRLVAPFGLSVAVETAIGAKFARIAVQPGETAHAVLERCARQRGVLLFSDRVGGLKLTRPGAAGAAPALIVLGPGGNAMSASASWTWAQRWSEYRVLAQAEGHGERDAAAAAAPAGRATDGEVGRYRPLIVLAENAGSDGNAQARAEYQRDLMAARSFRVAYTVQGWRANKRLWQANTLVDVTDPLIGLSGRYVIAGVVQTLEPRGGSVTWLDVRVPDAFAVASGAVPSGTGKGKR